MINLIGILILIIIEAIIIMSCVSYCRHIIDIKEKEIIERDKLLADRMEMIRKRNIIIREKTLKIEELENEIKQLKRENNKRL